MSTHFIFPRPRDWETFEDIVADLFSRQFNALNLQRYGRHGQKQYGVDIVGMTNDGIIGVQCKHRLKGDLTTDEIDDEIAKAERFQPELQRLYVVTSAHRDAKAHSHVLQRSDERTRQDLFPVEMLFWEDVYGLLVDYPDLLHKHFTRYFPAHDWENIRLPSNAGSRKSSLVWPVPRETLHTATEQTIGSIQQVQPYVLTLGLTTFPSTDFAGQVDLIVQLQDLFQSEVNAAENFRAAARILTEVRTLIADQSRFSRELWLHMQCRLAPAFLSGWMFRRVTGYRLRLMANGQVWATDGLPYVPARLTMDLPILVEQSSSEIAIILNINRNITPSVIETIGTWITPLSAVMVYGVEGQRIVSAAHALAVAQEIARQVKNMQDHWRVSRIHLFGALPAALATLISYHLNAVCPISLYFLSRDRSTHVFAGELSTQIG